MHGQSWIEGCVHLYFLFFHLGDVTNDGNHEASFGAAYRRG